MILLKNYLQTVFFVLLTLTSLESGSASPAFQATFFAVPVTPLPGQLPTSQESHEYETAMQCIQTNGGLNEIETFVSKFTNSPWTPSLEANLGKYYNTHGQYSRALMSWQNAWKKTKELSGSEKRTADFVLANWTKLLLSLGRIEQLSNILVEASGRTLDYGPLQQTFNSTRDAYRAMVANPGRSYRCGSFALFNIGIAMKGNNFEGQTLADMQSPATGFTLYQLEELSKKYDLNLIAAKRLEGGQIPVPSVINWKQQHYAAIVSQKDDKYLVVDPTFGGNKWLTAKAINDEASGYFLIERQLLSTNWIRVFNVESSLVYGKGGPNTFYFEFDKPPCTNDCPPGCPPSNGGPPGNGCSTCKATSPPTTFTHNNATGMPVWWVTEPYINVWLEDEPIGYQPALGPRFSFTLFYKEKDPRIIPAGVYNCGAHWNPSILSFINLEEEFDGYVVSLPGGGDIPYYRNSEWDGHVLTSSFCNNTLTVEYDEGTGATTNMFISFPDGSKDEYLLNFGDSLFIRTKSIDKFGNSITYIYNADALSSERVQLTAIIDGDGKTNYFRYNDLLLTNQITSVEDAYGRTNYLAYDHTTGLLTNIIDVIGLSSSFLYDTNGYITNLHTPYGDTGFAMDTAPLGSAGWLSYSMLVSEPSGSHQLFAYLDSSDNLPPVPDGLSTNLVPTNNAPQYDNTYVAYRNSYRWGRMQYDNLSSSAKISIANLSSNDFQLAHWSHWRHYVYDAAHVSDVLSFERGPTPDASTFIDGQMTWYAYDGQDDSQPKFAGTTSLPRSIGKVLPDGSTTFVEYERNQWEMPTNVITSYTMPDGTIGVRTNSYIFDDNGIDLLFSITAAGYTNWMFTYDGAHRILTQTDGVGNGWTNTYDTSERLISVHTPTGMVVTNLYNAAGFLSKAIDINIARTNSYTYTNTLVFTHTDERGLTTTNYYDPLQRLVKKVFPDNTSVQYVYSNLDVVSVIDRLGYSNKWTYNALRQPTSFTDANHNKASFAYCECGSLSYFTNALNFVSSFKHDNQGRLISAQTQDGHWYTNIYDLNNRLVIIGDSAGVFATNTYNNQSLLQSQSNAFGLVFCALRDIDDHITNYSDFDGVSVNLTYDQASHLLSKQYPDGGSEHFVYSNAALIFHTNRLMQVTSYGYDAGLRIIAETNALNQTNAFTFDAAGDLLSFIDGKGHHISWQYDIFGRITSKMDNLGTNLFLYSYDANSRLTTRYTAAKGTTSYSYDNVGNLVSIAYPVSPSISFAYNALNQCTNMSDAVGVTAYCYDVAGHLIRENSPWNGIGIGYTYINGSKSAMTMNDVTGHSFTETYKYDNAARLSSINTAGDLIQYGYDNTVHSKVAKILFPNSAFVTNSYNNVASILETALVTSDNIILNKADYIYNSSAQVTKATRTEGDYIDYVYDVLGELVSAKGAESGGATNRLNEQFGYGYDAGHNLISKTNNDLITGFVCNSLNEITQAINSNGSLTVVGTTTSLATNVMVNAITAHLYDDATFAKEGVSYSDGTNIYAAVARDSLNRVSSNTVSVVIHLTNVLSYDLNGNLISDGLKNFSYDDENQLISVTDTNSWRCDFVYDGRMRKRILKEYSRSGTNWTQTNEVNYVYDGEVVVQELDNNKLPTVIYIRGVDVSGRINGNSGVGGIVAEFIHNKVYYIHSDRLGNITTIMDGAQKVAGSYLYDPFGKLLALKGDVARINKYRFASQEWVENCQLYSYILRFYSPSLQRWINRDPFAERGGNNLYVFADNNPTGEFDSLGASPQTPENSVTAAAKPHFFLGLPNSGNRPLDPEDPSPKPSSPNPNPNPVNPNPDPKNPSNPFRPIEIIPPQDPELPIPVWMEPVIKFCTVHHVGVGYPDDGFPPDMKPPLSDPISPGGKKPFNIGPLTVSFPIY